jgi:hypothetical protein
VAIESARLLTPRRAARASSVDAVATTALLATQTGATTHVIVPREPGVAAYARAAASRAGLEVEIDLMPATMCVRFECRTP